MTAPNLRRLQAAAQPVATVGNDLRTIVAEAPFAATVTAVSYTPVSTQAGANTNSRTLNLYNRGTDGTGVVLVATLALVSGVDLTDNDEKQLTLSATPANLVVAANDILEFESLHVGTGIADPGGLVAVEMTRN